MNRLKNLLIILIISTSIGFGFSPHPKSLFKEKKSAFHSNNAGPKSPDKELKLKAIEARRFARQKGLNQKICFLADMSLPSGKNRLFVYDLIKDSILTKGLVAHGSCDNGFLSTPMFSNTPESGCSSLGKYRIGYSYHGSFGLAYKLYGLDSSNSNAYIRNIVLHAYSGVPEQDTDPDPICNSRGCAMIAPGFLEKLRSLIDNAGKPLLLWIFD